MRYSYISGYEYYRKALRTYIRNVPHVRAIFHMQMWGLTLVGVACLAIFWSAAMAPGFQLGPFVGYMIGCCCLGGGVIGAALMPWQRHRFYRLLNGDDKTLDMYIETNASILIIGKLGKAESRFERAAVCRVIEDDEVVLLFISKKRFVYIPKSIGDPALADLHSWLALPGAPASC